MMSSSSPSFAGLRRAADQLKGSKLSSSTASHSLTPHIPPSFSWNDLASELARPEDEDKPQHVVALRACLDAHPSRLEASIEGAAPRRQIRRFVARILTPIDDNEYDASVTHGGDNSEQQKKIFDRCQAVAEDGLAVLERVGLPVLNEMEDDDDADDTQVLYTITALADAGQPWTTDAVAAPATRLLDDYFGDASKKQQWIVDDILKRYLRPLFARSRPATVTASGRKAAFTEQTTGLAGSGSGSRRDDDTVHAESPQAKSWKYVDLRSISVFAWAVHHATGELLRVHWPLFTPVLLTLVDDPDTPVRTRGLALLQAFVAAVPDGGGLLHTTGLDSVLADAVFPTLHFLPRLTPEKESLQLLAPAYGALLGLAQAAAAAETTANKDAPRSGLPPKAAASLLDRVLREGIYSGYFYASDHIHIVEELVRQAGRVVEALGVYSVKHLKDLIPIYAAILTDPFAMRYMPAVAAAVDALQATLVNCWPRLANTPWQEETLKMLMLSWLHVVEEEEQSQKRAGTKADKSKVAAETAGLKTRLVRAADTLLAILKAASVDISETVGPLVDREPRLAPLFKTEQQ